MAEFKTHVGLVLRHQGRQVTIEGATVKVLYPPVGEEYVFNKAEQIYRYAVEHYTQRQIALEAEGEKAEGLVPYMNANG